MNYRTYIWKGGVYPAGDPKVGQEWCFAYGEKEWVGGKVWQDVKQAADSIDENGDPQTPVGQVDCVTGAAI